MRRALLVVLIVALAGCGQPPLVERVAAVVQAELRKEARFVDVHVRGNHIGSMPRLVMSGWPKTERDKSDAFVRAWEIVNDLRRHHGDREIVAGIWNEMVTHEHIDRQVSGGARYNGMHVGTSMVGGWTPTSLTGECVLRDGDLWRRWPPRTDGRCYSDDAVEADTSMTRDLPAPPLRRQPQPPKPDLDAAYYRMLLKEGVFPVITHETRP